jgi:hypothetical protein
MWWALNYVRFYLRVTSLPASMRGIFGNIATAAELSVGLNSTGTLCLYDGTTNKGSGSTALTDTTKYYRVEIQRVGSTCTLYVDGVSQVSATTTASQVRSYFGATGTTAATYTAYFDDISRDDAALPGAGAVLLLKPTTLNNANGWVEGDGAGTAGMAAAVATCPPPGVASADETAATNIESATNSATDDCDMNMTTYAAAGIGASDTINAVQGFVRHGEDIATTSKNGAHIIVSNPTQVGENTWNYGDGAHGAESGTNVWATAAGTIQTSPSVVLGTAPVLRVGKRTATTRVVCVDFMGIYVDYTPGEAWTPVDPMGASGFFGV